jgi:hypothetical protein
MECPVEGCKGWWGREKSPPGAGVCVWGCGGNGGNRLPAAVLRRCAWSCCKWGAMPGCIPSAGLIAPAKAISMTVPHFHFCPVLVKGIGRFNKVGFWQRCTTFNTQIFYHVYFLVFKKCMYIFLQIQQPNSSKCNWHACLLFLFSVWSSILCHCAAQYVINIFCRGLEAK